MFVEPTGQGGVEFGTDEDSTQKATFGQVGDVAESALGLGLTGLSMLAPKKFGLLSKMGKGKAFMKGAAPLMALDAALSFATATRHKKVASGAGAIAAGLGTLLIGSVISMIPVVGFPLAVATGLVIDPILRDSATGAMQTFNDMAQNKRGLHMGGDYEDSRASFTMRQRAVKEIGNSVLNARQYLGKEAALMHQ